MKLRNVLEGVGTALLLLLPHYTVFLNTAHVMLYHHRLPVTNLIGGLIVDLLGVAILATGFLVAVQYLPALVQRILYSLFAALMIWNIIDIAFLVLRSHVPIDILYLFAYWDSARCQSCIATLLLSGMLAYFFPRTAEATVHSVRLAIAALAFSALWIVPQLLYVAQARHSDESAVTLPLSVPASSGSNPRIVWILFDELSYDMISKHLVFGIRLPNFDRLRTESVLFSNLRPVGLYTDRIIPSLFLGQRIDQIRSTPDGILWYMDESQHRWLAYDPGATLFGLAQRYGWSSGIDGTFNPYCRLFRLILNVCSWESYTFPIEAYGASEEKSVAANATALPKMLLAELSHSAITPADLHLEECRNVMGRTHALIENDQVRFVFLHLPVPHPPGIYDRKRRMLGPSGTYLDNLVLADDILGVLLQEINATRSASQTTVIVSSDHSWRVPLWRDTESWSDEEESASGGVFDERPVLLIHFPGENSGIEVNSVLPELLEHDMIAGMLRGQMNSPRDLAGLLSRGSLALLKDP